MRFAACAMVRLGSINAVVARVAPIIPVWEDFAKGTESRDELQSQRMHQACTSTRLCQTHHDMSGVVISGEVGRLPPSAVVHTRRLLPSNTALDELLYDNKICS